VRTVAICLSLLASTAAGLAQGAALIPIGTLAGTEAGSSVALGISGDGNVVIGYDDSARSTQAFRWTEGQGMSGLGYLPNRNFSDARSASADGSVVVGFSGGAFAWTSSSGMQAQTPPPGGICGTANGVSANGTVAVGECQNSGGVYEAVLWSSPASASWLGTLPGANESRAWDVSGDGSVAIGLSIGSQTQAFRWTAADGMVGLGFLDGGTNSQAFGISADGTAIVGSARDADGLTRAFRWTADSGMQALGPGTARAASADGSVVVGSYFRNGLIKEAFVWTEATGMQNLFDLLVHSGVEGLDGWHLEEAAGISDDGRRIVGNGYGPDGVHQGFIVALAPVPAPGAAVLLVTALGALGLTRSRTKRPGA
jgi:probable HAF family extracellular repeat protein